jgi:DNA-binding response OmpR family regulator
MHGEPVMSDHNQHSNEFAIPAEKLILIVDDDTSILDLIERVIVQHGFKVERATDGNEALQKSRSLLPNLIILDFMLPGLSGFELIHQMQVGETAQIPILVITGRRLDPRNIELMKRESNIQEFLEKPIRVLGLTTAIHRILRTRPPVNLPESRGSMGSKSW